MALQAGIVGLPNVGKSTLFNALTGARQKIANYPGVTVERKAGRLTLPSGEPLELIDLPGSYSFDAASPDEEVTRKVVHGEFEGEATPEVIVLVVDLVVHEGELRRRLQTRQMQPQVALGLGNAGSPEVVEYLCEAQADPNRDHPQSGYTPLMLSCILDRPDVAETLVRARVDPSVRNK